MAPLGATRAAKATVETFIEPTFKDKSGQSFRPDGLIRVHFGKQDPWVALVEVKTGSNALRVEQVNSYIELARAHGFDMVITISNEIAPSEGQHPTVGLNVRSNSRVKVAHFSWTRVAAIASRVRDRSNVDDHEQAWILGELLRYLEHQNSGALEFDDMGESWTAVRDAARGGTVAARDPGTEDVASRWDQLMTYAAMKLSIRINEDVEEVLPKSHRTDAAARRKDFAKELADEGTLTAYLRVPRTAGDIQISADLRARQVALAMTVAAPSDKKARGSLTWLTRQLPDAPDDLHIDCYAKGSSRPVSGIMSTIRTDPAQMLDSLGDDIARFVVRVQRDVSVGRRGGKNAGFVGSVIDSTFSFYDSVVQPITPYQERAPKASAAGSVASERELGSDDE
ncbi:hypothetical protein [Demequina sp. NBRC 110052]|uniref:hypothetical protein n=1 Tax=Demequina sp. NBRC 110052 TaxID=1570341 RepID=UPI00117EA62E|nr:hypothetical protein [Demequina sp. NBRC 110052]